MAHDYKRRSRKKQPASSWAWFFAGLAPGLAVALVVYLQPARTECGGAPVAAQRTEPASQKPDDRLKVDETEEASRFDFYTMLPGLEVPVPEEPAAPDRRKKPASAPARAPGRYWIQAGSFRRLEDADRRKAELALLGLASSIQAVAIDGQDWHRVRIGPLADATAVDDTRRRLADASIGALAVRERN